jgi:hypothetical protein
VIPFMQVGTYPSTSFAFQGILQLEPPFVKNYDVIVKLKMMTVTLSNFTTLILKIIIFYSRVVKLLLIHLFSSRRFPYGYLVTTSLQVLQDTYIFIGYLNFNELKLETVKQS